MNPTLPYIIISSAALLVLALLAYAALKSGRPQKLTLLTGLAFAFVLAGILFGPDRIIGYGLIALGVFLAVIEVIRKSRGPVG